MEKRLIDFFDKTTPDLNPLIAHGLASTDVKDAALYVHRVIESVFRNKPQGLTYLDYERATPQEEYIEFSKKKKSRGKQKTAKRVYDLARSNKFMVKYFFEHNGVKLDPFFLAIPYCTDAGMIMVRGTKYTITPVLTDPVFSVGIDNIFTRLLRAKVTFRKDIHYFKVDNKRELAQVIWSKIHNAKPPPVANRVAVCNTPLLLYTMCKFGFAQAFMRFAGLVPVVGDRTTITTLTHPEADWVICETGVIGKPKTSRLKDYVPSTMRMAVRRSDFTVKVKNLVGTFFFIVDHFPNQVLTTSLEDTGNWQHILGLMLFSYYESPGKIRASVRSHMASLDNYIDTIVESKLLDLGYHCDNLYTFFAIVLENFNEWMKDASDKIVSMYGKELNVLYWLLLDVTNNICNLYFKLTASEKVLAISDINKIMRTQINTGLFFKLTSGHAEMSVASTSSSCKVFKITSALVSQSATARSKGGKKPNQTAMDDATKALHESLAEVGSHLYIQKTEGTGRSRLNTCIQVDSKRRILRNPDLIPMMTLTHQMISEK